MKKNELSNLATGRWSVQTVEWCADFSAGMCVEEMILRFKWKKGVWKKQMADKVQ